MTDVITSINPIAIRVVMTSLKTTIPKNTAVTGSSTPNIAVGVDPIYCIASVVHISEMTVGKTDNAMMFAQSHHFSAGGVVSTPLANALRAKIIHPTAKTYKVTFIVAIFFILDLLTITI